MHAFGELSSVLTVFIRLTVLGAYYFWTLRVGEYSRLALILGWALIKFSPFSAIVVCLFCNKTINANNKTRRSNKERFLYNTLKKTPSSGKSLIRIYSLKWVGWG